MSSPSNNSIKKDYGQLLKEKEQNKKPVKRPSGGGILASQSSSAAGGSSSSSGSSSSGSGGRGGSGGGGGGGGVAEAPTKYEARAIVMAGMKEYLGREASSKEVKAFFKNFTSFAGENNNSVGAGVQKEFMEDWIDDRPDLRKEYAQMSMATRYTGLLDKAINSARSL